MKFAAKIKDIGRTLSGNMTITLESQHMDVSAAMELSKLDSLEVEIKKYRKKRSLDANAYYWLLIGKLSDKIGQSNPWVHNYMLREYGQIEIIDGKAVYIAIPDTEAAYNMAYEAQEYHIKPTSEASLGDDGIMYRTYMMLRGSRSYDTKEMSKLIDGLVRECGKLGIETLSPEELDRMMTAYGQKYNTKKQEDKPYGI